MKEILYTHIPWIFSGVGLVILAFIISLFKNFSKKNEIIKTEIIQNESFSISNKRQINEGWQNLLHKVSENIIIFGGDISWINRDHAEIKRLTNKTTSIDVKVLCNRPKHENSEILNKLKSNMKLLIYAGAQVKYYNVPKYKETKIRGIISDPDLDYGEGLIVKKVPKTKEFNEVGSPGSEKNYDYLATRLLSKKKANHIKVYYELFNRIWETAFIGIILDDIQYSNKDFQNLLNNVPEYSDISENNISLETVQINNLYSLCHIVKIYKFPFSSSLINAYQSQQIELFKPCYIVSSTNPSKSILLPPIVEEHDDKLQIFAYELILICINFFPLPPNLPSKNYLLFS